MPQNSLCHLRLLEAESCSILAEGTLWPFLGEEEGLLQKTLPRYYSAAFLDTDLPPPATLLLITGFQSASAVEIVTDSSWECQGDVGAANGKGDQGNLPFP